MYVAEENTTLVGVTELRFKLKEVLKLMLHTKVVLEKRNEPFAVLVPLERYQKMEALLEAIEDRALGYLAKERDSLRDADYLGLEAVEKKLGFR